MIYMKNRTTNGAMIHPYDQYAEKTVFHKARNLMEGGEAGISAVNTFLFDYSSFTHFVPPFASRKPRIATGNVERESGSCVKTILTDFYSIVVLTSLHVRFFPSEHARITNLTAKTRRPWQHKLEIHLSITVPGTRVHVTTDFKTYDISALTVLFNLTIYPISMERTPNAI